MLDQRIDRIARGSGHRGNQGAVAPQQTVEDRGLADVGPSDQRQPRLAFELALLVTWRQQFVGQIVCVVPPGFGILGQTFPDDAVQRGRRERRWGGGGRRAAGEPPARFDFTWLVVVPIVFASGAIVVWLTLARKKS